MKETIKTKIGDKVIELKVIHEISSKIQAGDVYRVVASGEHGYRNYILLYDYTYNDVELALVYSDFVHPKCGIRSLIGCEKIGRLSKRQAKELSELLYSKR